MVEEGVGVVDGVGVGWHPIGTRGGEISQEVVFKEVKMWPWYGYSYPWRWMPSYWGMSPYSWPWAPMPKDQEITMLEQQASMLETGLDSIRKRLEELKK